MADLKIPAAAETALALGNARHAITLTVAAEVRRLADHLTEMADKAHRSASTSTPGLVNAAAFVLARAAELDPSPADPTRGDQP